MNPQKVTRVVHGAYRSSSRLSKVPREVEEHYGAIGSVLSVGFGHQQAISQYQLSGRIPVFKEELTDECHRALLRGGWRFEATDGTYRIGDCILFAQPEGQRDENREDRRLEWLRLDDEDTYRAEVEGMREQLSGVNPNVGADVVIQHLSRLSDHVRRGPVTGDAS
jgi:hypothetical protein